MDRQPTPDATPVGRLMRFVDHRWEAVGEPLPAFDHAPPDPTLPVAPWVLPRTLHPRAGDVVVVGELAHRLTVRCEPGDPAVQQLVAQTLLFSEPDQAGRWLNAVELWWGHRLDPTRPWPSASPPGRPC